VRDKHSLPFGATPAHQPERPSEPRPSGVHPEEGAMGKRSIASISLRVAVQFGNRHTGCTQQGRRLQDWDAFLLTDS